MTQTRTELLDAEHDSEDGPGARPGDRVGKYVIRTTIGAGGCGTVYAAYDPVLDREVAIKLLVRNAGAGDGATKDPGWPRLVGEARMLARLSEPQVVTVYDVGEHDGQAYLAMQMVKGGDLKQWIARHRGHDAADPKPLDDALDLLEQAGRGLAVAHEAGVVHGDFKPANVLIDARGRAKVSDFGIARLAEAPGRDEASDSTSGAAVIEPSELAVALAGPANTFTTSQGRPIVGTPAYMAPEQFGGNPATVASDVYAFCATLYEAIYGALPFAGKSLAQLGARKAEGKLELPSAPPVPHWLARVLTRGLSVEPSDRPLKMAGVLEDFARGRSRPRRRWFIAGGALGGAALVGSIMAWRASAVSQHCRDEAAGEFPWTSQERERVAQQLSEVGPDTAKPVVAKITAGMDGFAEQWVQTYAEACTAAWSEPELADQAFACLRRRRSMAAALLEAWRSPSAKMIDAAFSAVSALPSVQACVDPESLAGAPDLPEDAALREQVIVAREQLAATIAMARTGAVAEARTLAESTYVEATALGYEPLVAQAALAYGQAMEIGGEFEPAREKLREAFFAAQRWDDYQTAAGAAERLVHLVGTRLAEYEQGLLWVEHARVALAKTGGNMAVLLAQEGSILERLERREEALQRYQDALAAHEPDDHYGIGVTHMRTGDALRALGRAEEALAHYDQTIASWSDALGPDHPRIAIASQSRATALSKLGRNDEAIAAYESALVGLKGLFGPDHVNVSVAYVNLGLSLKYQERYDEAEVAMREALRINIQTYGEEHLQVAHRRDALGRLLTLMGRGQEALEQHQRVQKIYDTAELPEDHSDRVIVKLNLGEAHQSLGAHDRAVATFEEAVAIAGKRDDGGERRGDALVFLGKGLAAAGRTGEARATLAQAIGLLEGSTQYADSHDEAKRELAALGG